ATATAAAVTAPAPTPAVFPRPGLVDGEGAAARLLAVQGGDGRLGLLVRLHFDEAEALGAACVPVHDDLGGFDRTVRLEHRRQVGVGYPIGQVAHIQFLTHHFTPEEMARALVSKGAGPVHESDANHALAQLRRPWNSTSRSLQHVRQKNDVLLSPLWIGR